jgi:hypothetical protein
MDIFSILLSFVKPSDNFDIHIVKICKLAQDEKNGFRVGFLYDFA